MENLISTLKLNESISFDLIQNPKGEEHYKNDFISIDLDNLEQEAASGFYDGVEINIYSSEDIKGFDKLAADKSAWEFILPIIKTHVQGVNAKQLEYYLSSIGANLKELSIDFSDFHELNTSVIVEYAPKVKKLTLKGDSWEIDNPIILTLDNIELLNLDFLKIDISGEKKVFDLSKVKVQELELDDFDASESKLPNLIKKLVARVNCNEINWSNLKMIETLELSFCADSNVSDLTFLGNLDALKNLTINLDGESSKFKIRLPAHLETFDFNTNGLEIDLEFLASIKKLKHLTLKTNVSNGGKGFKNLDIISNLQNLETLELEENALGTYNYKSEFKPKSLNVLSSLRSLFLDGMMNIKSLSDFSGMESLEYLTIRDSKIDSLKGISNLVALKKLELVDCHFIDNLSYLTNSSIENFSFSITSVWGTEVLLKKEHIQQLDSVSIKEIEISIEGRKFPKKEYPNLVKKYDWESDGCTLWLSLKE